LITGKYLYISQIIAFTGPSKLTDTKDQATQQNCLKQHAVMTQSIGLSKTYFLIFIVTACVLSKKKHIFFD